MSIENFLPPNYTEVDSGDFITVEQNKVSWNDLTRNGERYVYADKGVDHFYGFTHKFKILFTDTINNAWATHWELSNDVDDTYGLISAAKLTALLALFTTYSDTKKNLYLRLYEPTLYQDISTDLSSDTVYYITLTRNTGSNTYTAVICVNGYAGEGGEIVDTISAAGGIAIHWRYIFPCNSHNSGLTNHLDGYTEDLDLGESVVSVGVIAKESNNLLGA